MQKIALILVYITEVIKYWAALNGIWKVKKLYFKAFITGFILYSSFIISGIIHVDLPVAWVWGVPLILLYFMRKSGKEAKVTLLKAYLVITSMGEVIYAFLRTIRKNSIYEEHVGYYLVTNILCVAFFVGFYFFRKGIHSRFIKKIQVFCAKHIHLVVLVIAIVLLFTISGIQFVIRYIEDIQVKILLWSVTILSFLGIPLLAVIFSYVDDENKRIKKQLETDRILLKSQSQYYEAMLAKEYDTRKFRHDIKNYLISLEELVAKEDMEQIKEYVGGLSSKLHTIENRYYSVGNTIMDAIINYYTELLDEDVKIEIRGTCKCNLKISDVDLCTVFSNLVQNAVEELNRKQIDNRFLKIVFNKGKSYLKIEIINSIAENKEKVFGNFVTSKSDKKNHGIGLQNVRETLERNNGKLETVIRERTFKVKVILPIKRNDRLRKNS